MMTIQQMRDSIVEHVAEVGKAVDGEYHKAVTAFIDFIERKDAKIHDAVVLLLANGYHVESPAQAAAQTTPSQADPAAVQQ
ncbi:hypothetical protein BLA39750_02198 [Burkholderia lata]|uniref:Uncharacterized protein n=1 Tax=Burkholderia lata (strain ATCC 17760 / DSM 23089 / LMG 22485 / NCIMB 9086 / R18194 / 383) TaxID=482957 RepID=A0A6P2VVP8_BURL3|nr:hypothetical protein [Burkholderia lata]VWC95579.1 hypothetical protein BLA39750_02198 [Burkholderia lata]